MPLTVIKGPPNSGRTEKVRQRYMELLPGRPVLIVPGVDDIFGWERRLTGQGGALVGGQILHFRDLYAEILEGSKEPPPREASRLQRTHLVRQAIVSEWREISRRLPDQPGLVESILELIDDFRSELVDVTTLAARIEESDLQHQRKLVAVFRRYLELLGRAGLTDSPEIARLALNRVSASWGTRPVMIAGFDEMTRQQTEMIRRLAFEADADVTVAVTHEPDNPALAITGTLISEMSSMSEGRPYAEIETTGSSPDHDHLLTEIAARFLKPEDEVTGKLKSAPGDALTIMKSTGRRNEAESIAVEIAKLLSDGKVLPGEIAVAVGQPVTEGGYLRDCLNRFDVPVTVEGETPAGSTVTGRNVLSLLRALVPGGPAASLFAYLRGPVGPDRDKVDELERECRINEVGSAEAVVAKMTANGQGAPPYWHEIRQLVADRKPVFEIVADAARRISLAILEFDTAPVPSPSTLAETRAGAAIENACLELAEFRRPGESLEAVTDALASGAIKVWAAPAQGTVRIASPYSLRAKRVRHLFYASLQEAASSDDERAGPFLSVRDRRELGMSERRDSEEQQRYLVYTCMTVPTEGLWLSCRTSDETGKAEHPSPLIAAVENLFEAKDDGTPRVNYGGRSGSEITLQPADAPSETELARSLAAAPKSEQAGLLGATGLDQAPASTVERQLESSRARVERSSRLGNLTLAPILESLGETATFSATELEAYAGCPYRWFIERHLNPAGFDPDPDYLTMGSLLHQTLDRLYSDHPGEIPRPETLSRWIEALPGLVLESSALPRIRLDSDSISHAALRSRAEQLIEAHLIRESKRPEPRHLPAKLEVGFGTGRAGEAAVNMGDWSFTGRIDRIDFSPDTGSAPGREAIAIDYKSGDVSKLTCKKAEHDRKFQIQLYLHAIRTCFNARPVAGIYVPLRKGDHSGRGAYSAEVADEMIERGASRADSVDDMNEFIDRGLEMADTAAVNLMAGVLEHDPATCPNHFDHPAVPDRIPADDGDDR